MTSDPSVFQTVLSQTLLCAARQIPVAGKVVEVWTEVVRERQSIADKRTLELLESRVGRFEKGQRELVRGMVAEALTELSASRTTTVDLSNTLRDVRAIQQSGYLVGFFQRMLEQSPAFATIRKQPEAYGRVLHPTDTLTPGQIPIFIAIDGSPRVLEVSLFALNQLIATRIDGCDQVAGANVWGIPIITPPPEFDYKTYFKTGESEILGNAVPLVNEAAAFMLAHPEVLMLEIQGHSDHVEGNRAGVSLARATRVRDHLVRRGVQPSRLKAVGLADEHPVAEGNAEWDHAENRRVCYKITKVSPAPIPGGLNG